MNNRNDRLRTREEVADYIKKICKNAEKHGLYITIICGECAYLSELSNVINYDVMHNQRKADTFAALFELQKTMLHWHDVSESERAEIRHLMSKEWLTMGDDEFSSMDEPVIFKKKDNRGNDHGKD